MTKNKQRGSACLKKGVAAVQARLNKKGVPAVKRVCEEFYGDFLNQSTQLPLLNFCYREVVSILLIIKIKKQTVYCIDTLQIVVALIRSPPSKKLVTGR